MRYLSVCSGIEAATVAWHPLGWTPAAFAEIEAFPRAVLAHHYPEVPLYGDFTTIKGHEYGPIDLLVGGTPCQDFSIAGLRAGIAGERGNLTLEFLRLAARTSPRWLVWENVPGLLSSDDGRALGAFLGGLAELGYGFAYRVLDAQYFGLAQRRERVFVVGYLGDWRRAAAVLFESESLRWDPPPRREAGQGVAAPVAAGSPRGSGYRNDADTSDNLVAFGGNNTSGPIDVATAVNAHGGPMGRLDFESETFIAFSAKDHGADAGPISPTLRAGGFDKSHANGRVMPAVAFGISPDAYTRSGNPSLGNNPPAMGIYEEISPTVRSALPPAMAGSVVRRLTPRECERLQGFPEIERCYNLLLCRNYSGHQKTNALAALQCLRLPSNVWRAAASGWALSAEAAAHHSSTSRVNHAPPVALDVLIDLERMAVRLHSAGRSFAYVPAAENNERFLHLATSEDFARLAALLTHAWGLTMLDGREAPLENTTPSTHHLNGNSIALSFGHEIEERAADAAMSMETASRCFTSTTLPRGLDIATLRSTLTTLSCCAVRAIAGCIPEQTTRASSFVVRLTTTQGYTAVPYRKKPAADGPRYKALGNSMAVPVMRWIGERIGAVERLAAEQSLLQKEGN